MALRIERRARNPEKNSVSGHKQGANAFPYLILRIPLHTSQRWGVIIPISVRRKLRLRESK